MTDHAVPQGRSTRVPLVVLGLVVGIVVIVVFLVFLVVVVLVAYALALEDTTPVNVAFIALLALPMVPGAQLLRGRRTRQAGAGLLMGLAMGLIVSAAVCATYLVVSLAAA